jgi:outer membrane receptor protein involved in Fe transport
VTFGINGTFNNYTNKVQSEAWNLPKIKLSSTLNYTISPKWYVGTDVFYVGERKDQKINMDIVYIIAPNYVPVTLKSYFDVNAHVGFKYSDQLTTYLRANNITNQAYERSLNYPVQGFQIVIGANYKFDF